MVITRSLGVEMTRIALLEPCHQFIHRRIATEFITEREHGKGGMIAEVLKDQVRLADCIVVEGRIRIRARNLDVVDVALLRLITLGRFEGTPLIRELHLKIEAEFIRRLEGSLRRTPGVEPHVVESPILQNTENLEPLSLVHGRIPRQRIVGAIETSAQEGGPAVNGETFCVTLEVTQSEVDGLLVNKGTVVRHQLKIHAQHRSLKLVPERYAIPWLIDAFNNGLAIGRENLQRLFFEGGGLRHIVTLTANHQLAGDCFPRHVANHSPDTRLFLHGIWIDLHIR